jgi:NAD(P)-dependent dehydrogenase (short-subunit alcohol dehydrogenase family)
MTNQARLSNTPFSEADIPDLSGKSALITGATGGLGFEMARMLAAAQGHVILAGRDSKKGDAALQHLRRHIPGANIAFEQVDLASLSSIRGMSARMVQAGLPIDILINNAGIMMPPARKLTEDGFELQLGTNHLGHFALTGLLLPLLVSAREPRVISISSGAAKSGRIHFDDLQFEKRYRAIASYAQSKLANLLFMRRLQQLSDERGWRILSAAAHPGYARTDLIRNGPGQLHGLLRAVSSLIERFASNDAAAGALPAVLAATGTDVRKSDYFGPTRMMELKGPPGRTKVPKRAMDDGAARRLWDVSQELTGVAYPSGSGS